MSVTSAERRAAIERDRDRSKVIRLGLDYAARIGMRAQLAAQKAGSRSPHLRDAVQREIVAAVPLLRDCMALAHMAGLRRVAVSTPGVAIAAAQYTTPAAVEDAMRFMRNRLDISSDELDKIRTTYQAEAIKVVDKAANAIDKRLQQVVSDLTAAGEHVTEGRKALAEAFEAAGMTPNNSFTLEAIWRTQTAVAYGAGQWQSAQAEEIQQILWGYKYVTVGDDRVRAEHIGFEGVTLPKEDPFWQTNWPPNGWACRCCAIEIFEERQEVKPEPVDVDGKMVMPEADKGFRYNAGTVLTGEAPPPMDMEPTTTGTGPQDSTVTTEPDVAEPAAEPTITQPIVEPVKQPELAKPEPKPKAEQQDTKSAVVPGAVVKPPTIADDEAKIAKFKTEHAIVYGPDGEKLWKKSGTSRSVRFTPDEVKDMKGGTLTHNHPTALSRNGDSAGELPLSPDDVKHAIRNGIAEIRAVTENYVFSVKRDASWDEADPKAFGDSVFRAFNKALRKIEHENMAADARRVVAGELTKDQILRNAWMNQGENQHRAWLEVARVYNLQYTKEPRT